MVNPVKECDQCGEVCSTMDTMCPRCQKYGTLRERYQCLRCRRLMEEPTCWACGEAEQFTAEGPVPQEHPLSEPLGEPRPQPNLVDPNAVHPALASGVGGAVFGAAAGAAAAHFFLGENPLIMGAIGLVIGGLVGALLGGNVSQGRR